MGDIVTEDSTAARRPSRASRDPEAKRKRATTLQRFTAHDLLEAFYERVNAAGHVPSALVDVGATTRLFAALGTYIALSASYTQVEQTDELAMVRLPLEGHPRGRDAAALEFMLDQATNTLQAAAATFGDNDRYWLTEQALGVIEAFIDPEDR